MSVSDVVRHSTAVLFEGVIFYARDFALGWGGIRYVVFLQRWFSPAKQQREAIRVGDKDRRWSTGPSLAPNVALNQNIFQLMKNTGQIFSIH